MPRNVYSEVNLHVLWHTKETRLLIKPDMQETVYDHIRRRAIAPGEVFVHEIGGTANHVHLAATIPPANVSPGQWGHGRCVHKSLYYRYLCAFECVPLCPFRKNLSAAGRSLGS